MKFEKILAKKRRQFEKKNTNSVNIRVDTYWNNLFLIDDLSYHEVNYLMRKEYRVIYQQDLYGKKITI